MPHPNRRALAALLAAALLAACGRQPAPAPTSAPTTAPGAVVTSLPATAPASVTAPTVAPASTAAPAPTTTSDALLASGNPERIAFAPGAVTGAVEGAIARGEERRYLVGARTGQQMSLRISSPEDNAVFQIYTPGGAFMSGAEPGRDARAWAGRLPAGGDYLLVVGSTRGGASFRLEVTITGAPSGADASIRAANWPAVFAGDPQLHTENIGGERYVSVTAPGAQLSGIPQLDQAIYLDMDGDGLEDAAIPLASGGTAGNIGALVFRLGASGPLLSDWVGGYKLDAHAERGQLVIGDAIYAGWEPNCCPSGRSYATYVLQAGKLALVAERTEGNDQARAATVERFYQLLDRQDFPGAYALLAAPLRAATPYDTWLAGYAATMDVQATVTPDPAAPDLLRVALTATDKTTEGGQVTRRFAGTWRTVWEPDRPGWALADPQVAPTP